MDFNSGLFENWKVDGALDSKAKIAKAFAQHFLEFLGYNRSYPFCISCGLEQ